MVPRLDPQLQPRRALVALRWRHARLHPTPQARRVLALAHLPRRHHLLRRQEQVLLLVARWGSLRLQQGAWLLLF